LDKNPEKFRDLWWLLGISLCIFLVGPLYHEIFQFSISSWPLTIGGASLAFCLLLFGFFIKEIILSILEKSKK